MHLNAKLTENMSSRRYSRLDRLIIDLDQGISTLFRSDLRENRLNPATGVEELPLTGDEQRLSEGLMRVNHSGEVSAQALYQGQSLTARDQAVGESMKRSANEEIDHLVWCRQRIRELGGHTSYLNPIWYAGSFLIGAGAGVCGDRWSLGFITETEHQVVRHLEGHLDRLPANDLKSRTIVEQMKKDESHHATVALEAGAAELPAVVKQLMQMMSKVMTWSSFRL